MRRAFKILAMLVAGIALELAATWVTASRGIVLFRTLIDDERHLDEIDAAPCRLHALQCRLNQGKKETS
jgi:hypothetical protein